VVLYAVLLSLAGDRLQWHFVDVSQALFTTGAFFALELALNLFWNLDIIILCASRRFAVGRCCR